MVIRRLLVLFETALICAAFEFMAVLSLDISVADFDRGRFSTTFKSSTEREIGLEVFKISEYARVQQACATSP